MQFRYHKNLFPTLVVGVEGVCRGGGPGVGGMIGFLDTRLNRHYQLGIRCSPVTLRTLDTLCSAYRKVITQIDNTHRGKFE